MVGTKANKAAVGSGALLPTLGTDLMSQHGALVVLLEAPSFDWIMKWRPECVGSLKI